MTPRALERAYRAALSDVDLESRVRRAAASLLRGDAPVDILAVGKAAPAMLRGALAAVGPRARRVLVVVPDGVAMHARRATVLRASHPLPDARSVRAADRARQLVATARDGRVLVLVSGGASSLLCAPYGMTLARKIQIIRALLHASVPISELNTVRRHLSWIKGGGLLREARVPVVSLLASDVIAGGAHDIGSGPSVADPTTREAARDILARHTGMRARMRETLAPSEKVVRENPARIVATPRDLARALADRLARQRLHVRALAAATRDVEDFVTEYARLARTLSPGEAIVRAAEPTLAITVERPGRGGRASHLAAALALHLPQHVLFLAAASDGVDGSSGAAGAIVDSRFVARVGRSALDAALARFDTGTLHARAGSAIEGAPTGHNLADVHALVRSAR